MSEPAPTAEVKHLWDQLEGDGPQVGILMGSESDKEVMQKAADELLERGITFEMNVLSAHRNPHGVAEYSSGAALRGMRVLIAGAGKAAALPGVVAAYTDLPVIGVPIKTSDLGGMDSLLSIVQMPPGRPGGLHGDQRVAQRGHLRRQDHRPRSAATAIGIALQRTSTNGLQRARLINCFVSARPRRKAATPA